MPFHPSTHPPSHIKIEQKKKSALQDGMPISSFVCFFCVVISLVGAVVIEKKRKVQRRGRPISNSQYRKRKKK
ncbi:uncharacterized protein BDW47DRAFT_22078 [Aspergillus candidus]|uniref:Uncharacterized protein n=1 Tax=Aspergillus candidus TaxID=41067 RepID=A0A2I2FDJ9_ASPCN|nr:hypothetical protein BDW47DRAFT_22078 [Aspergillus candidus]PLB38677.1 hypothetical protein BDW47DRAFT_22078 [Aspergillus candidus]